MTKPFSPPIYLKNPHIQTILNSIGPRRYRAAKLARAMASERLVLQAKDGTRLLADFDRAPGATNSVVILIHGWEGCSNSAYQITTASHFLSLGVDVLRINLRDHGDSHHLNRELFNSTRTAEVGDAIADFLGRRDYARVFLAGYSLGGSFALRIAADRGPALGLTAAAAICPPVDPANAMEALNDGWFVYQQYFFRRWARSLRTKLEHFPDLNYGPELERAKSVDDLNRFFIPRHTPFADPDSYFSAYALGGNRLRSLQIPAYLIAAADDPIIPSSDIDKLPRTPWLNIDLQQYGGHCGFVENLSAQSWAEKALGDIFLSYS